MTLYWNLALGRLVAGIGSEVGFSSMSMKRGDAQTLEVIFFRGTAINALATTTEMRFAVKPSAAYVGDPLVFTSAFTQGDYTIPQTGEIVTDGIWTAEPSTNTVELNDYFADLDEPDSVSLKGEITFRLSETAGWNSSQTFEVTIENDLIKGEEGTPTNAADPTNYLTATQSEARYVRYDASQSLTGGQKTQSRTNIGALADSAPVVRYDAQTLTSPQKTQVLTNLGLVGAAQVNVYGPGTHTWSNPSVETARLMQIILIGGGGGGGSGRKGTGDASGGGGGAPGSVVYINTTTVSVGGSFTVVVGAGGAGGAERYGDDSSGVAGASGGDSTASPSIGAAWTAKGGNGGSGGTSSTGTAGAGRTNSQLLFAQLINSLAGGAGNLSSGSAATSSSIGLPTGGGGGGGNTAGTSNAGGAGGGSGSSLVGLSAGASGGTSSGGGGVDGSTYGIYGLGGGGGGAAGSDGTGGNGAPGGLYGGGGGGGGAAGNGAGSSGAGGAGGAGLVVVAVF